MLALPLVFFERLVALPNKGHPGYTAKQGAAWLAQTSSAGRGLRGEEPFRSAASEQAPSRRRHRYLIFDAGMRRSMRQAIFPRRPFALARKPKRAKVATSCVDPARRGRIRCHYKTKEAPGKPGASSACGGGDARIRTGGKGFAGLCLTTWPRRRSKKAGQTFNPTGFYDQMERTTGFEPATPTLARLCSTS